VAKGRYTVYFVPAADRSLRKLPDVVQRRIVRAVETLADDPRPPGAKKLAGQAENLWRIRFGDYRIVYQIQDERLTVLVLRVGHRGDIYRTGK
jgi:mRNA interferase RelE/StbE